MPFITEEIYHLLKERNDDLVVKQFAPAGKTDADNFKQGNKLKEIITAIRDARNKHNLKQKETIKLHYRNQLTKNNMTLLKVFLSKQVNAESIDFSPQPENSFITLVAGKEKIYIEADIEVDTSVQKEKLSKRPKLS